MIETPPVARDAKEPHPMKLGNTKTVTEIRSRMKASYDSLMNEESHERLRNVLREEYPEFAGGCILRWTPDQGEDVFIVLVNGSKIISVELDREDFSIPPIVEHISLSQYKLGLKRSGQIALAVAQEMLMAVQ